MHKGNKLGDIGILDLTKIEQRVLKVLLSGFSYSVARVERKSKVGYTSVKSALIRLHKRGLVRKHIHGKRFLWKLSGREKINREISEVLSYTHTRKTVPTPKERVIDFSDTLRIELFSGLGDIAGVIKEAFQLHKTERLLIIENASATANIIRKHSSEYIISINKISEKHHVISEGIITEGVLKELQAFNKKNPLWGKSFLKRMFDVRVVESSILDNLKGNLSIYRDVVLITDWDKETLIRIKNRETVALITTMFRALQETGKKVNIQTLFEKS